MYDTLFGRRIHRDAPKLACERGDNKIIQTVSVSATSSRLTDIIANNRGVHCVAFEPEIKTFYQAIKKSNGLGFDLLRKAFDNDEIYRINKDTSSPQGLFPVALNLIMTGTPGDTRDFIKKELEGGTISRFCWCVMPKPKKDTKAFPMPQGKVLSDLQNQIDALNTNLNSYEPITSEEVDSMAEKVFGSTFDPDDPDNLVIMNESEVSETFQEVYN